VRIVRDCQLIDGVLDALADHIQAPLEARPRLVAVERGRAADEQLFDDRRHGGGIAANRPQVGGDGAPAQHGLALLDHHPLDQRAERGARRVVLRQEHEARTVGAGGRQGERQHLPQEAVRHLHQNARAIAGVRVGAGGAAVFEVHQQLEGVADDVVGPGALDMRDKADATGAWPGSARRRGRRS
jgi:hypothetical protein